MGVFENTIIKERLGEEPYPILKLKAFIETKKCLHCHKTLEAIGFYKHDAGILLQEAENRQWVFSECYTCKYQNALWKLCREEK